MKSTRRVITLEKIGLAGLAALWRQAVPDAQAVNASMTAIFH